MSEKEPRFMPADVEKEGKGKGLTAEEFDELRDLEKKTGQFPHAEYLALTAEDKNTTDELINAFRRLPEGEQRAAWERMKELEDKYEAEMVALRNRHKAKK